MTPLRCAVVGSGKRASDHEQFLRHCSEAELTPFPDYGLDALDALFVATGAPARTAVIIDALEHGLAVFCDPPLASDLPGADTIVATASTSGGLLAVGQAFRFDPNYAAVIDAVRNGSVGEVVQVSARYDIDPHQPPEVDEPGLCEALDVLTSIAGPVDRVFAATSTESDDAGSPRALVATLRFAAGCIGVLAKNTGVPWRFGPSSALRLAVFGSRGSAFIDGCGAGTAIYTPEGLRVVTAPHSEQDRQFLGTVRRRHGWPVTPAEARASLALLLDVKASAERANPLALAAKPVGQSQ